MQKIDFKFLTERAEKVIVNEMARLPTWTMPEGYSEEITNFLDRDHTKGMRDQLKSVYGGKDVTRKVFQDHVSKIAYKILNGKPLIGSSTPYKNELLQDGVNRDEYFNFIFGDNYEAATDEQKKKAMRDTGKSSTWLLLYLLNELENKKPGYIMSNKFTKTILDPEIFKGAFEDIRNVDNASRAKGKDNQIIDNWDMSPKEFYDMTAKIYIPMKKIRKEGKKFMSSKMKVGEKQATQDAVDRAAEGGKSDYITDTITGTLEGVIDDIEMGEHGNISEEILAELRVLYKKYLKLNNKGVEMSVDDVRGSVEGSISNAGVSTFIMQQFNDAYTDAENIDTQTGEVESIDAALLADRMNIYGDEFLRKLVETGIISEEEKDLVSFYKGKTISDSNYDDSGEPVDKFTDAKTAINKYTDKMDADAGAKKANKQKISDDNAAEIEALENELEDLMIDDDPDQAKIKRIENQIRKLKGEKPVNEGIMGYMTEQAGKDRFTHKKGEFKDRGFKRFPNYAMWMEANRD